MAHDLFHEHGTMSGRAMPTPRLSRTTQPRAFARRPAARRPLSLRRGSRHGDDRLTAVDAAAVRSTGTSRPARPSRDGVVVQFAERRAEVRTFTANAAEALSATRIDAAATAYPPGVPKAPRPALAATCSRAAASLAANWSMKCRPRRRCCSIDDGALVDVGGGSTGVGVVVSGRPSLAQRCRRRRSPSRSHPRRRVDTFPSKRPKRAQAQRARPTSRRSSRPGIERIANSIGRQIGGNAGRAPCISSAARCASRTRPKSSRLSGRAAFAAIRIRDWSRLSASR